MSRIIQLVVGILCFAVVEPGVAATIVSWEEFGLADNAAAPASSADESPLVSQGVTLNRSWNHEFDCCAGGWAISRQTDQATPGLGSAFAAVANAGAGGGFHSDHFAVANSLKRGEATVQFAQPVRVDGFYATNTTYAYRAVVDGNDGAGFVKGPFKTGDWFELQITGMDANGQDLGALTVAMADYRVSPPVVLRDWTWIDLSPLGAAVTRLEFAMSSSDTGMFGMNTPAYFAMDNLSYTVVPEAATGVPLGMGLLLVLRRGRRR